MQPSERCVPCCSGIQAKGGFKIRLSSTANVVRHGSKLEAQLQQCRACGLPPIGKPSEAPLSSHLPWGPLRFLFDPSRHCFGIDYAQMAIDALRAHSVLHLERLLSAQFSFFRAHPGLLYFYSLPLLSPSPLRSTAFFRYKHGLIQC